MPAGMKNAIKTLAPAVLSGILLALALPGRGLAFLVWVALVPLLGAIRQSRPGEAFAACFLAGILPAAVLLAFIPRAAEGIGLSRPMSLISFLLPVGYFGLYVGVFGFFTSAALARFRKRSGRNGDAAVLFLIPALWTSLEFIHSLVLPSVPWTWIFLGYFIWDHTLLIQIAEFTGIFGLSYLVVLGNTAIFLGLIRRRPLAPAMAAGLLLSVLVYGRIAMNRPFTDPDREPIRAAILQGAVTPDIKWDQGKAGLVAERYLSLCREAARRRTDLVVWTETAIPWPLEGGDQLMEKALSITLPTGASHLIGAPIGPEDGGALFFNSALFVLPDGRITGRYDKFQLLALVEAPGFGIFPGAASPASAGYRAGGSPRPLATGLGRIGVTICNENFYPAAVRRLARRGAEFLVNMTNDAWWPDRSSLTGHFVFNVIRAVENRRETAVASNVGISAFIDAVGRVREEAPINTPWCLTGEIRRNASLTFYSRRGDLFAALCLAVSGLAGGVYFFDVITGI